jgi:hypothetical protein
MNRRSSKHRKKSEHLNSFVFLVGNRTQLRSGSSVANNSESGRIRIHNPGNGAPLVRGMRHTSTALYFYEASKKTLHKPRVTFGNML